VVGAREEPERYSITRYQPSDQPKENDLGYRKDDEDLLSFGNDLENSEQLIGVGFRGVAPPMPCSVQCEDSVSAASG
jgi:hypothetical protein